MATITFDTLKFVERLKAAGVSEEQAKAEAEALRDALAESTLTVLATRADIDGVERKLIEHDGEFKIIKWMLGMLIGGVVMLLIRMYLPS